jgi:hypothetical protein
MSRERFEKGDTITGAGKSIILLKVKGKAVPLQA